MQNKTEISNKDVYTPVWKENSNIAAQNILKELGITKVKVLSFFKPDKSTGGNYWLEIREPLEGVRLICFEIQKDISPLTLRCRMWFYKDKTERAKELVEKGFFHFLDESVKGSISAPRATWKSKLEKKGVIVEGVEYALRKVEFLLNSDVFTHELECILNKLFDLASGKGFEEQNVNYPDEVDPLNGHLKEGSVKKTIVNKYERSLRARMMCIEHHGPICSVCNFNFEKKYGDLGAGFIHVHHIVDLALINEEYEVDPVNDLIPVCPNCHCMLHKKTPAYTVKELKLIMQ